MLIGQLAEYSDVRSLVVAKYSDDLRLDSAKYSDTERREVAEYSDMLIGQLAEYSDSWSRGLAEYTDIRQRLKRSNFEDSAPPCRTKIDCPRSKAEPGNSQVFLCSTDLF